MRRDVQDAQITTFPGDNDRPVLFSTMRPWPDVKVSTWLVPPPAEEDGEQKGSPNWHLRIHKIESGRDLVSAEGGFAIKGTNSWNGRFLTSAFDEEHQEGTLETPISAAVVSRAGVSGVRDLSPAQRDGQVLHADANSNLVEARTLLPVLYGDLKAGEVRWFVAGVFGLPAGVGSDAWKGEWRKQWEADVKVPGWVEEMVKGEEEK
jgi:hypothetical protein